MINGIKNPFTHIRSLIVILALWGWFPVSVANWINNLGEKND